MKTDGWVEGEGAVLSRLVIALMQFEIDRFISTMAVAKDYFAALGGGRIV